MIGYALSKTGVHSLALNLSQQLPESNSVITILPITIDTP
jgi:short-subunit dehydrogenase involved in D-alanine esterification of teichoic acids